MKNSLRLSCLAAALFSAVSAGNAFAWHDHYRGGVVIYDGYGPGYPGYYAPPPVIVEPAPMYAYPPQAYAPAAGPVQYAPVPDAPVYQAQNGQYCREYQTQINVEGHLRNSFGTACRQPDGSWKMIN